MKELVIRTQVFLEQGGISQTTLVGFCFKQYWLFVGLDKSRLHPMLDSLCFWFSFDILGDYIVVSNIYVS